MKLPDMTLSDVAREIGIRRESVKALALSGALVAYDASPLGAKRKTFRFTRQALDEFKAQRSAKQVKTTRRKFVAKQPENFVRYFE